MKEHFEKRKHLRFDMRFPVKFRDTLSSPPVLQGALATDISPGGLQFQTENFLPRETSLIMELHIPGHPVPVRAVSKVTWLKSLSSGYQFAVGSRFTETALTEDKLTELCAEATGGKLVS